MLIDLIFIIRRDFISKCGVIFLGIFDYNLVYVITKLKSNRVLFKYIKIRD